MHRVSRYLHHIGIAVPLIILAIFDYAARSKSTRLFPCSPTVCRTAIEHTVARVEIGIFSTFVLRPNEMNGVTTNRQFRLCRNGGIRTVG